MNLFIDSRLHAPARALIKFQFKKVTSILIIKRLGCSTNGFERKKKLLSLGYADHASQEAVAPPQKKLIVTLAIESQITHLPLSPNLPSWSRCRRCMEDGKDSHLKNQTFEWLDEEVNGETRKLPTLLESQCRPC
jgi:hypothetical protein